MIDNSEGFSISLSTPQEYAQAAMGMADANMVAIIAMMRVISQGLNGEDAYQIIAQELMIENENRLPGKRGEARHMQLGVLSVILRRNPED